MTKGELKEKLSERLIFSIINIVKDPTLGDTVTDQLQGLIFNEITDDWWDNCDDSEMV